MCINALLLQVVVFRGEAVAIEYQSGMYTCGDKLVHTFPAYWPSLDQAARCINSPLLCSNLHI